MQTLLLTLGIISFLLLVITHELGHFWAARRNGVVPEEFGIFFPPTIYRKKMKKGWDFTINLLPLGGFVKLRGEHDSDTKKGSFGAASDWAKSKIMLAGVAVNLVTALALFTILGWVGMPKIIDNQFSVKSDTKISQDFLLAQYVEPNSPAEKAGINRGDKLVSIYDISEQKMYAISGKSTLRNVTKSLAGKLVKVTYESNGNVVSGSIKLRTAREVSDSLNKPEPKGYLGIEPYSMTLQKSTWSAPIMAGGLSWQITKLTLKGIGTALKNLGGIVVGAVTGNKAARQNAQTTASSQVSGPLGIFFVLKAGASVGVNFMMMIIAVISLTLAIMNVLPVPALDGGRLYLMLASRLTRQKKLSEQAEEAIVGWSFVVLLALIVLITFVDFTRFF